MTKSIKLRVFNKEDYYSSVGEYDELEEYLEETGLTEKEFFKLQDKVNNTEDIIELSVTQDIINEYVNEDKSNLDLELQNLVYEELLNIYNLSVSSFELEILEIK